MPSGGRLFLVGGKDGRNHDRALLERFAELCGGARARVLVITTACADPARHRREYREAFDELGLEDVTIAHPRTRSEAESSALLNALTRADGVYFSGGDQCKLVNALGNTAFHATLRERHARGLPVGGTSAGASAVSARMIAGGRARRSIRLSSVELADGLALQPTLIVDQHFRERKRLGRLVAAVLRNPGSLGFGVDEATAAEIDAAGRVAVCGRGLLTVVDGAELMGGSGVEETSEDRPACFAGIRLAVLGPGWRYDIGKRRATPPVGAHGRP